MTRFVEFTALDKTRITLDLDIIRGYSEEKDVHYQDQSGKQHTVPDHTLIITGGNSYRVLTKYDDLKELLEEEMFKNDIGL